MIKYEEIKEKILALSGVKLAKCKREFEKTLSPEEKEEIANDFLNDKTINNTIDLFNFYIDLAAEITGKGDDEICEEGNREYFSLFENMCESLYEVKRMKEDEDYVGMFEFLTLGIVAEKQMTEKLAKIKEKK